MALFVATVRAWAARVESGTARIAKLAMQLLVVVVVAVIAVYLVVQVRRDVLVIETVNVATALADSGYTGDALADRLAREVLYIETVDSRYRRGGGSHASSAPAATPRQRIPDIELPETKASLQRVVALVRELVGHPTSTVTTSLVSVGRRRELWVGLRDQRIDTIRFAPAQLDSALRLAAQLIVRRAEPAAFAAFSLWSLHDVPTAADTNEAERWAYEALRMPPTTDDAYALMLLGWISRGRHQPWNAVAQFRAAARADPTLAHAYVGLGDTFDVLGRVDDASRAYQAAVQLDPSIAWAWVRLADESLAHDDVALATSYTARARAADSLSADVFRARGDLAWNQHRFTEAASLYTDALNRRGDDAIAGQRLGSLAVTMGRCREAAYFLQNAVRADSSYVYAQTELAQMRRTCGDAPRSYAIARTAYDRARRALAADSTTPWNFTDVADALALLGRYPDAARVVEEARVRWLPESGALPRLVAIWQMARDSAQLLGAATVRMPNAQQIGAQLQHALATSPTRALLAAYAQNLRDRRDTIAARDTLARMLATDSLDGDALVSLVAVDPPGALPRLARYERSLDPGNCLRLRPPLGAPSSTPLTADDPCDWPNVAGLRSLVLAYDTLLTRRPLSDPLRAHLIDLHEMLIRAAPEDPWNDFMYGVALYRLGDPLRATGLFAATHALGGSEEQLFAAWVAAAVAAGDRGIATAALRCGYAYHRGSVRLRAVENDVRRMPPHSTGAPRVVCRAPRRKR